MAASKSILPEIVKANEESLLSEWLKEQLTLMSRKSEAVPEKVLVRDSTEFLKALREGLQTGGTDSITGPQWKMTREVLDRVAGSRAKAGLSPTDTAMFVFSLKQPLFALLKKELSTGEDFLNEVWATTLLMDRLGLYTTETFQRSREQIISRQQEEMMELSTPVVKLWDGILALPMIGTLDSARTQIVMETLLQRIVETGSEFAILDITGVPTVDTLVAQHLIKTVTAARLMGAECIISGIRPQIASTIVHLGVDLNGVLTKASLADAFKIALQRMSKKPGRDLDAAKSLQIPNDARPLNH